MRLVKRRTADLLGKAYTRPFEDSDVVLSGLGVDLTLD